MLSKRRTSPGVLRNRFLARLPEADYQSLLPLLQPVPLSYGQVLYEPGGPIEYAYFPTGAVLSALTVMRDGNAIEVATIGNEGMVGHYGLNGKTSPHRMIVQIEDGGLRIPARALQKEGATRERDGRATASDGGGLGPLPPGSTHYPRRRGAGSTGVRVLLRRPGRI